MSLDVYSLDVYLEMPLEEGSEELIQVRRVKAAVDLLRKNGLEDFAEEILREHSISERKIVYSANITHNLVRMAVEAGIYLACWRPKQMMNLELHRAIEAQSKSGNYNGAGGAFDLEEKAPDVHAKDLIEPLQKGLDLLRSDPKRFEKFNASNGWGLYEHFVPWVQRYLDACKEYPDAVVSVSR